MNCYILRLMSRVSVNSLGDQGLIPGPVIPKTQKWYLILPRLTLSIIVVMLTKESHGEHKRFDWKTYIRVTMLCTTRPAEVWPNNWRGTPTRWLVHWYLIYASPSVRVWHKAVFKVGPVSGPLPRRVRQLPKLPSSLVGIPLYNGRLMRQAINLTPSEKG